MPFIHYLFCEKKTSHSRKSEYAYARACHSELFSLSIIHPCLCEWVCVCVCACDSASFAPSPRHAIQYTIHVWIRSQEREARSHMIMFAITRRTAARKFDGNKYILAGEYFFSPFRCSCLSTSYSFVFSSVFLRYIDRRYAHKPIPFLRKYVFEYIYIKMFFSACNFVFFFSSLHYSAVDFTLSISFSSSLYLAEQQNLLMWIKFAFRDCLIFMKFTWTKGIHERIPCNVRQAVVQATVIGWSNYEICNDWMRLAGFAFISVYERKKSAEYKINVITDLSLAEFRFYHLKIHELAVNSPSLKWLQSLSLEVHTHNKTVTLRNKLSTWCTWC